MILSFIAAMSENRVVGRENKLPWHLPEDLKRFRQLTQGHPVIMGRKTHESIGRLLPGRENVVLSRQPGYRPKDGARLVASLDEALAPYQDQPEDFEVFVIGGAEIWRAALPLADRIHLTVIHQQVEGDAWFPDLPPEEYLETFREDHEGAPSYSFLRLDRARRKSFG